MSRVGDPRVWRKPATGSNGKVVAVDLDNVICDSDPKIRELIRKVCRVSLLQQDITNYAYAQALIRKGIDAETAKGVVDRALTLFHNTECLNVVPIGGALEGLKTFSNTGFSVLIATSRPGICADNTREWIRRYGVPHEELLFLEDKTEEAHNWALLIEDALHQAEPVCESGIPVCLLDYPWNKTSSSCRLMHRAKDWREIVNIVFEIIEDSGNFKNT